MHHCNLPPPNKVGPNLQVEPPPRLLLEYIRNLTHTTSDVRFARGAAHWPSQVQDSNSMYNLPSPKAKV